MSEVNVTNIEINNDNKVSPDLNQMHYIGVVFESKYTNYDRPKIYEYKTTKPLREGDILNIDTMYGHSTIRVVKENIPVEELQYDDIDNIKEI